MVFSKASKGLMHSAPMEMRSPLSGPFGGLNCNLLGGKVCFSWSGFAMGRQGCFGTVHGDS